MRCNIDTKNKLTLISQSGEESKFQILQYNNLKGVENYKSITAIKNIEKVGQKLKQVRIELNNSMVKLQDNSISYIKGNIFIQDNTKIHKRKKIFFDRKSNEDSDIKTRFNGTGEILLEPSFDDFTLVELIDEEILIDDNIFFACDDEINVNSDKESNKLRLKGSGNVVLKIPVPESEIIRCKVFKDELIVRDNIVILQTGNIKNEVENYEKTIDDEIKSEIFNKYTGIGEVWILPTRTTYRKYGKMDDDYKDEVDNYTEEKDINL